MIVRRIDTVTVFRTDAAVVTPEGFHLYDALYARTGNQEYDDGRGGVIIEYRPDGEVFHPDSLASYELRPLTDLHPPRNVTTDTARMLARGATSAGRKHSDGRHVAGRLAVWDGGLIEKFAAAFARGDAMQLSAGYELDVDYTPGTTPDGKRYDAVQRNIRINHVAAVPLGRAGTARVLADGRNRGLHDAADMFAEAWANADAAAWALAQARSFADIAPHRARTYHDFGRDWAHTRHDAANLRTQYSGPTMKRISFKLFGRDTALEVAENATPEQVAAAISTAHEAAAQGHVPKADHDKAVADAVKKARDEMAPPFGKKPEEEEEAKKKDAADRKAEIDKIRTDADARATVLATALSVIGPRFDAAGKSNDDIKIAVVEAVATKTNRDGAAARKELQDEPEATRPGAISFAYRQALKDIAALPQHHEQLVDTIRTRFEQDRTGKTPPKKDANGIVAKREQADEAALQTFSSAKAS